MNDEELRTVKSLQDGGTYIVRFKEDMEIKDIADWIEYLELRLIGRNIRLLPELPRYFEFVGEPIEKIK